VILGAALVVTPGYAQRLESTQAFAAPTGSVNNNGSPDAFSGATGKAQAPTTGVAPITGFGGATTGVGQKTYGVGTQVTGYGAQTRGTTTQNCQGYPKPFGCK
jgi:hypothetical protein